MCLINQGSSGLPLKSQQSAKVKQTRKPSRRWQNRATHRFWCQWKGKAHYTTVTTLDVNLDQTLNLLHVNNLCKSSYYHLRALRHIRASLPDDIWYLFESWEQLSTQQPAYLHNLIFYHQPSRLLRSSSQSLLQVPRVKTDFGRRAFSSAAPQIWIIYQPPLKYLHHLTPSNVTSKHTILPLQFSHHLATPPHLW